MSAAAAGLLLAATSAGTLTVDALLRRAAAEIALTTALRASARILDPADWPSGPRPRRAEATFRALVVGDGDTPISFAVEQAGRRDPATGFTFPAFGVSGCLDYRVWPVGPQPLCADEVTRPDP